MSNVVVLPVVRVERMDDEVEGGSNPLNEGDPALRGRREPRTGREVVHRLPEGEKPSPTS